MPRFIKKPIPIEATQWFKNGDHPDDYANETSGMIDGRFQIISGEYRRERNWEGSVVRYFRRPDVDGEEACKHCGRRMHDHGWLDTLEGSGGAQVVCPGDWIITGIKGERYPCKPDIFAESYEPAP